MLLLASLSFAGNGAAQTITVGPAVQVSPTGSGFHWFTSIVADPDDRRQLIACGIRQAPRQNSWQGFVYISHDGGDRWAVALVDSSSQNVSEETCAFGANGAAYFIGQPWGREDFLANRGPTQQSVLHLYRSRDSGYTWSGPVISSFLDYARMAVDNTDGRYRGRVYVFGNAGLVRDSDGMTWSEKELVYSADSGKTLSKRVRPARPTSYHTVFNVPQHTRVLPSGAVLGVYWTRYLPLSSDSAMVPRRYLIEAVRTVDGGQATNRPVVVARMIGAKDGVPGMDVDASDMQFHGRVYVTWADSIGGRERVFLATSSDEGTTWSTPRVVDDTPASVYGTPGRGPSASIPSIAVNKGGVVAITWSEQHGDCWRMSASSDGGMTFLPSVPLNVCPRKALQGTQQYAEYLSAVPSVEFASGRYDSTRWGFTMRISDNAGAALLPYGIAAAADGTFHPLWVLPRDAGGRLWTTTVAIGPQQPLPALASSLTGLVDVTSGIGLILTNVQYDEATQTGSVDVSLLNRDRVAWRAPIYLRVVELRSPIASVSIKNADNRNVGQGAIWDMSSATEDSLLRPNEETHARRLVFAVGRIKQLTATTYGSWLSLVAVEARILARPDPR